MNSDSPIHDYLNGHLNPREREAFEQEIRLDPDLAKRVETERIFMQDLRGDFEAWDPQEPDPSFGPNLLSQLASEHSKGAKLRRFVIPVLAAAALVLGFIWLNHTAKPKSPEPSQVRAVVASNHPLINIYVVDPLPADLWKGEGSP